MRTPQPFAVAVVALSATTLAGCGQVLVSRPVTIVATTTPGVAMVIVRPQVSKNSVTDGVDRRAEYVLLCDGRQPDGMRCDVLPEVGGDRRSRGVTSDRPAPLVNEGVATLSDLNIRYSSDESVARGAPAAAPSPPATPAAPVEAAPPAPPPAPPAPPPAPAAPPAAKGTP